mmetsp:Transcript_9331/g.37835  ORF Transcript_9331/g.37835 Transcript_9331/m.37835 type:complete len:212 (-) Transcript_9331:128-763(-)
MHRGCATQSHRGHATRAPTPRTPSPPHAAHLLRAPEMDGISETESPSTVTTRLSSQPSSSFTSSRSFPSVKDPPTDRLSASMSPTETSTCSGGASHLSLASFAYSGLRKCTRRGRFLHGETCSIAMTSLVLFASDDDLSLTLSRRAASLTARLSAGFCHAHSNCSAWTFDGNPCTRRTISHGRSLRVYLAPAAITPLCCRMRRSGLTVNPT